MPKKFYKIIPGTSHIKKTKNTMTKTATTVRAGITVAKKNLYMSLMA